MRRDDDASDQLLHLEDARAIEHFLGLGVHLARGAVQDGHEVIELAVADDDLEEEAVKLRFGQRVRAFLFDGVLRRQHQERLHELVRGPAAGHAALLHGFEQGRLRLGRGAVDFIGKDDLGEDRAPLELKLAPARRGVFHHDVGADHVGGHQVGRELNAAEGKVQRLRERAHEQGLAQPGHTL